MPLSDDTVKELSNLSQNTLVTLYEIDVYGIIPNLSQTESVFRFYDGTNFNFSPVSFDSNEYVALPMEVSGFGRDSQRPPRPTIRIANIGGVISDIVNNAGGLEGAKITRKRVFLKNIDASNFPSGANPYNASPDPLDRLNDDIFLVNRKASENDSVIEWELAMPIDLENSKFPSNQIMSTICRFRYRGNGCGYAGLGFLTDGSGRPLANCRGWSYFSSNITSGYRTGDIVMLVENKKDRYYRARSDVLGANLTPPPPYNSTFWEEIVATEWATSTSYDVNDIVYKTNNSGYHDYYVCIKAHTSSNDIQPENAEFWTQDKCGKRSKDCASRFAGGGRGMSQESAFGLNFGGYLGVERLPVE